MNNLKQNAQTAVKWSAILTFGNQCVSFLISVILARLLTPSDYGLVGTISIFIEISGIFVTGGLSMALIRKIDRTQTDLATVFYYNTAVSILIYLVLYTSAPFIAQHATATCCRGCIYKWHKMRPGKELSKVQQEYLVDVIMTWIEGEMKR